MAEERVQKALARMGYGSRREIERLIGEQKIRINGQLAKPGDHVKDGDKINIGNRRAVISVFFSTINLKVKSAPKKMRRVARRFLKVSASYNMGAGSALVAWTSIPVVYYCLPTTVN